MKIKLAFKIGSLLLAVFILQKSVYWFNHNPNIARLMGKPVGATGAVNLEAPNPFTPSISGFSNNLNTATANISYGIEVPTAPGGMKPNLSLSYSSGAVDDMHVGINKVDINKGGEMHGFDWTAFYKSQASWVGLGWDLGGLGFIARKPGINTNATVEASQDDEFVLAFPGGSTRVFKSGDTWKTDPEMFLKIEHETYPNDPNEWYAYDTAPWIITTPDGSKYYFGQPIKKAASASWSKTENGYFLKTESGSDVFPIGLGIGLGVVDQNKFPNDSLATVYTLLGRSADNPKDSTSLITSSKWMLRKIEDNHSNVLEIDYETRFKGISSYGNTGGWSSDTCYVVGCPDAYIHDITPKKIRWGKNTVEFSRSDRPDWQIENYGNQSSQPFFTKQKLDRIEVKVNSEILRSYTFSYGQSLVPDFNDQPYPTPLVGHLLLANITQHGRNGEGSLPAYSFTYYTQAEFLFNNTLLATADNGYGRKVTFSYQGPGKVLVCNTHDYCEYAELAGVVRNRIIKKKLEDGLGNNFEVSYNYFSDITDTFGVYPRGYVKCDDFRRCNFSDFEFLGYNSAEEITSKLNEPTTIVAKSKVYFTKAADDGGNGQYIRQAGACFNVDPRRGKTFKTETYDLASGQILAKNESQFEVTPGYIDGEPYNGGLNCRHNPTTEKIPALVTKKQDDNYLYEGTAIQTRVAYGPYDQYGNLLKQIGYGDIDKNGDERTTHFGYYPNTEKWILNKLAFANIFKGIQLDNTDTPNLIAQTANYYDGSTDLKAPPTKGDLTMARQGRWPGLLVDQKMAYDQYGNLISQTDAKGNTSTTTYDDTYHLYPVSLKNPLGQEIKTEYDYVLGAPIKVTDPNAAVTLVAYDGFGRRIKVAKSPDDLNSPTLIFTYQDGNPAITKTQVKIDNNGGQSVSWQIVNGLGQTIQARSRAEIDGQTKDILSTTVYDSLARKTTTSQPYELAPATADMPGFTQDGWQSAPKNEFFYDDLGRTIETKDSLGRLTHNRYQGWSTTVTDAAGRNATIIQNAYGKNTLSTDPQGNTTSYEYDILGNLTKVTTPIVTTIEYDALNRKTKMVDPDLGVWTYQYDANGNLISQKDAKNQEIRLEYDSLNRLTKKTYPDGKFITFEYDQGANAKGKRNKMVDLTGKDEYFYDIRGQLIKEEKTIEDEKAGTEEKAVTEFGFNNAGALAWTKYPDGEKVEQTYNQFGQLEKIKGQEEYLTDINYNVLGATNKAAFGNQTQTQYQYDLTGRLQQILTKNQTTDLIKWQYNQDPVGNITKIEDLITPTNTLEYTYDELDRLKTASGLYSASYAYDNTGNMLSKIEGDSTINMEYIDQNHAHAPKIVNGFEYRYDTNGNLLEDEARLIEWDYDNKPKKITLKATSQITEFEYDGDGRRVIRRVLGDETPTPSPTTTPTLICPDKEKGNLSCDAQGLINEFDLTIFLRSWGQPDLPSLETLLSNWKTS